MQAKLRAARVPKWTPVGMLVAGAIHSAIVVITYRPGDVTLRYLGEQLTAHLAGVPSATRPDEWLKSAQRQGQFLTVLGFDDGIWQQLRRAAGLLAPLLAALVTTLLPDVKL